MRRGALLVLLLAALGCSSHTTAGPGPLAIEQQSQDPKGEQFAQMFDGDRLIVDVESRSGNGRATFRPGRGVWPEKLSFRFHLRGLEGFEARGAKEYRTFIKDKPLTTPPVVDVPKDVYEGSDALEVRWVDFYR